MLQIVSGKMNLVGRPWSLYFENHLLERAEWWARVDNTPQYLLESRSHTPRRTTSHGVCNDAPAPIIFLASRGRYPALSTRKQEWYTHAHNLTNP